MSEAERYLHMALACEQRAETASEPSIGEGHLVAARSWRLLADTLEQVRSIMGERPPAGGAKPQAMRAPERREAH